VTTKATLVPGDGDPRHGTLNGYGNLKCRCQPCRDANAIAFKEARAKRKQRLLDDPSLAPHGRESTYGNWGCRCDLCTAAWSNNCKDRTARRKKRLEEAV
jgi:hypothetical protein